MDHLRPLPSLTAEQTAERLGIKVETLYSYVARGRLTRVRTTDGSRFDPLEVESLASSRRRQQPTTGHSEGRPLLVIETDFARIYEGELSYRGRSVSELVLERFETVAHWALTGDWDRTVGFAAGPGGPAARKAADSLPASASDRDRQLVAVIALGAADPLRTSLDPGVIAGAVERIVAGMVEVLPQRTGTTPLPHTTDLATTDLTGRLWSRLTAAAATPESLAALNAALVLLIDHDLAVSTLAARAAASARATASAVLVAGMGALDSPLHGNASRSAHRILARVVSGDEPTRVLADAIASAPGPVPGFGHPLYPTGDPRARILLRMLADIPGSTPVRGAVDTLAALVQDRTGAHPNIDLALGALSLATGMRDDAGEVVFATARTVGFAVHALAEYREEPLRLRPRGRYTGPDN